MRFPSAFQRLGLASVRAGVALLLALALTVQRAPAEETAATIGGVAVKVLRNVAYGAAKDQRMDIYLPAQASTQPAPVILMVHGGAWAFGDKGIDRVETFVAGLK